MLASGVPDFKLPVTEGTDDMVAVLKKRIS